MRKETERKLEEVLREKVRPALRLHGGDIAVESVEDGIMKFRLTGQCSGCPSADITTEEIVKEEVTSAVPEIKDVVLVSGASDEMIDEARRILQLRHKQG